MPRVSRHDTTGIRCPGRLVLMYAWLLLATVPVLWQAHRLLTWGRQGLQDGGGAVSQSPAPDVKEQETHALYAKADVIISIDHKSTGKPLALQLGVRLADVLGAVEAPGGLLCQLVDDPGFELYGRDKELAQLAAESARGAAQRMLIREGSNSSRGSSLTGGQIGQSMPTTMAMLAELGADMMARRAVEVAVAAQQRRQHQVPGSSPWSTSPNVRVKPLQPGPTAAPTHSLRIQAGPVMGEVVNRGHNGWGIPVVQGAQYVARLRLRSIKSDIPHVALALRDMGRSEDAGSASDRPSSSSIHHLTAAAAQTRGTTDQASAGRRLQAAAGKEGAGLLAYAQVQDTIQRSWHEVASVLEPGRSCSHAELVVQLKGPGTLDVDHVSLLPLDAGMAGDPARVAQVLDQQSHTSRLLTGPGPQPVNPHIVAALQSLRPDFIHLAGDSHPAADVVTPANAASNSAHEFSWNTTLGPAYLRPGHYNEQDGTWSTDELGLFEQMLLAESIPALPSLMLPVQPSGAGGQVQVTSTDAAASVGCSIAAVGSSSPLHHGRSLLSEKTITLHSTSGTELTALASSSAVVQQSTAAAGSSFSSQSQLGAADGMAALEFAIDPSSRSPCGDKRAHMGHAHPWAVNTAAIGSGSCVQNEAQVALYAGTAQLYKEVSPHMRLLGPAVCGERSQGVESAAGVRHIKGVDLWQVWLGQALDLEQLPRQLDLALEAHEGPPVALLDLGGRDTRGQGLLAAALSLAAALVVAERHANKVGMAAPSLLMAQEERLPGAGAVADLWGAPLLLLARSGHATPTPLYHMYKAFIKNTGATTLPVTISAPPAKEPCGFLGVDDAQSTAGPGSSKERRRHLTSTEGGATTSTDSPDPLMGMVSAGRHLLSHAHAHAHAHTSHASVTHASSHSSHASAGGLRQRSSVSSSSHSSDSHTGGLAGGGLSGTSSSTSSSRSHHDLDSIGQGIHTRGGSIHESGADTTGAGGSHQGAQDSTSSRAGNTQSSWLRAGRRAGSRAFRLDSSSSVSARVPQDAAGLPPGGKVLKVIAAAMGSHSPGQHVSTRQQDPNGSTARQQEDGGSRVQGPGSEPPAAGGRLVLPPQLLYASAVCPRAGCAEETLVKLVNQGEQALHALLVLATDGIQHSKAEALVLDAQTLGYDGSMQGSMSDPKLIDSPPWEPLQMASNGRLFLPVPGQSLVMVRLSHGSNEVAA